MTDLTHAPCCSSHGVDMDCETYRRTHFVEVGSCCSAFRSLLWHRECTATDLCGISITVGMEDPATGAKVAIAEPTLQDPDCPLCGAPFGPWIAGPAPTDEEDL
jgi:hypothetical protein